MFSTKVRVNSRMSVLKGVAAGLFGVALLAGCGGSDEATSEEADTFDSASVGTIENTEPLSVLINEAQLDQQTAEALDYGEELAAIEASNLGTQAEIQSISASADAARAARVAFGTAVVGSVGSVNTSARQIKVMGQTIQISNGTVFDSAIRGGLAGVTVGSILEVRGLLDAATGITNATRVDLKRSADLLILRGVVSQVNMANKTLRVGGQMVNIGKVSARAQQNLAQANGMVAVAVLESRQVNGQYVARAFQSACNWLGSDCGYVGNGKRVDIENVVTQFSSNTSFKLFGLPVDARNAVFVNAASLQVGAKAEVRGAVVAGVLVATNVNVTLSEQKNVQRLGAVAALNSNAKTFTLNGVKVDFRGSGVVFSGGSAANLANGVQVRVDCKVSTDGSYLVAQRIQFVR